MIMKHNSNSNCLKAIIIQKCVGASKMDDFEMLRLLITLNTYLYIRIKNFKIYEFTKMIG